MRIGLQQPSGTTCSGGSAASTYDVTVITKPIIPGVGIPTQGTLDIVVYFANLKSDPTLSAATAGADSDLQQMESRLRTLLAGGGLAIGTVRYVDLPDAVQTQYALGIDADQTGGCSQVADLFRNAAPGTTLNIFFVSQITAGGSSSNQVVGLDGTIPGPATIGGTAGSGAAVSAADLRNHTGCGTAPNYDQCGPDETAYIIAHEAGHFLGLYHVTEADGTQFDPLLSTPMCPCKSCASTPSSCATTSSSSSTSYMMSVADCTRGSTCGGGDNLMFWRLESGSQGTLLPEQASVMLANPLVQ